VPSFGRGTPLFAKAQLLLFFAREAKKGDKRKLTSAFSDMVLIKKELEIDNFIGEIT
jgi:hypothetical protein